MFLGVSQHADFISEVRFAPRPQQMGYPGGMPMSRFCHAVGIDVTFDAEFIFDTLNTRGDLYVGQPRRQPVSRSVTLLSRSVV